MAGDNSNAKSRYGVQGSVRQRDVLLDLLKCQIEPAYAEYFLTLDWQKLPTDHAQEDGKLLRNDLIWIGKTEDNFIIFPVEFQSSFDENMAARMLRYAGNAIIAATEITQNQKLPFVQPLLVHNTKDNSKFALPGNQPDMGLKFSYQSGIYIPLGMVDFNPVYRPARNNLVYLVHNFEKFRQDMTNSKLLIDILEILTHRISPERASLNKAFLNWLGTELFNGSKLAGRIAKYSTIAEAYLMLKNKMPIWEKEIEKKGIEKGMEKGMEKGKDDAVITIVEGTYNMPVPDEMKKQLSSMPAKMLKDLFHLLSESPTLEDFGMRLRGEGKPAKSTAMSM